MNILLTGATGFIGSHVAEKLLTEGHSLTLLKRTASNIDRISSILSKVSIHNADTTDDIEKLFKNNKIEMIMHLSGKYIKRHKTNAEVDDMIESNITVPSLLLDLATRHGVKYFINTGTFFEYKPSDKPINEKSTLEPFNFYAATKVSFEYMVRYYTQIKPIKAVTLKLFSPYGENDNEKVIPMIFRSFLTKKPLSLTKGEQQLSFTYVGDIVEAYIKAIEFLQKDTSPYEVFNIGFSQMSSIKDIVASLESLRRSKNEFITLDKPYPADEILYSSCDNGKAKQMLGWEPKIDIHEGLRRTYEFYRKNII